MQIKYKIIDLDGSINQIQGTFIDGEVSKDFKSTSKREVTQEWLDEIKTAFVEEGEVEFIEQI